MSKLQKELDKLQVAFQSTSTTRIDTAYKRICAAAMCLDPKQDTSEHFLLAACADLVGEALTFACSFPNFNLHRAVMQHATNRDLKSLIAAENEPLEASPSLSECEVFILMPIEISADFIDRKQFAIEIDAMRTIMQAEINGYRQGCELRDATIEASWKLLEACGAPAYDVSWPVGLDGYSKQAKVRRPFDKLPECIDWVIKRSDERQKLADTLRQEKQTIRVERDALATKLSKCMQAMETAEVMPYHKGEPSKELETCQKIAQTMIDLRRDLAKANNDKSLHAKSLRQCEDALTQSKLAFAEYRRNVEIRGNQAADFKKRLEIAAIADRITVHIDHFEGKVIVDGWRVETDGMRSVLEKVCGRLMKPDTTQTICNLIRDELTKIHSGLFASMEIDNNNGASETRAVIHINTTVRDRLAFQGLKV